jgi:CheY-like chemotaxis protein
MLWRVSGSIYGYHGPSNEYVPAIDGGRLPQRALETWCVYSLSNEPVPIYSNRAGCHDSLRGLDLDDDTTALLPRWGSVGSMDNKKTILVVDDDDMIRELLSLIITDNFSEGDVSVVEARDGVEGLRLAKSLRPAMIIIDVLMPNLDGLEVVRQLRSDPSTRSMSVITVSATSNPETAKFAGCDQFVHKPFELEEMIGAIEHWLPTADGSDDPSIRRTEKDRATRIDERTAANRARIAEIRDHLEKRVAEATARWDLIVMAKELSNSRLSQARRRIALAEERMFRAHLRNQQGEDQPIPLSAPDSPRKSDLAS